ncbi:MULTISPECIES: Ger(x)C family spore germination protein [Bacillaceae]|uniref:Ger(X)C family spore germination protein n=1 Tax=Evansella alkalicola TaxID=745819 RepID=A0ABS6JS88_9BACI|nr:MULTISPECIES: Ger(x)C family spore germination protein [Bacillaceae]MBU9721434.1 Ger(x)C family spore germination protein [Bacillus alkalicola]
MKKFGLVIIALILCTSCTTDSREIDQRTMILGMGIDKDQKTDDFIITMQVPVITPQEGGGLSASEFETISGKGETLWEAISNIEAYTPTVLFFGHLKAVVIGENLARSGVYEVLDLLDRRAPLANQVYLVVVRSRNEVNDFLDQESPLISLPSLYLDRFFNADQKLSRSREVKLFEFRRDMNMVFNAATLPFAYNDVNIVIEDMAVFHKGKLVGELTGSEAGKSELIKHRILENMNYNVAFDQEGHEVTVSARVGSTVDINYEKTNPVDLTLDISGKAEIVHLSEHDFRTTKDHLNKIQEKLEEEIKEETERTIQKMKDINVEPWLIGHEIWAKNYEFYKTLDWEETGWVDSNVTVNVEIEVEQTGQRSVLEKKKLGR